MTRIYVVDTSVISTLAPDRPENTLPAAKWLLENSSSLYLSTVTIAEIQQGIAKLLRIGGTQKARKLELWLRAVCTEFGERIIPVNLSIAKLAGEISDAANAIARNPGFADVLIAATAKDNDAELLTRNIRHFQHLGIQHSNPFEWSVN